MRSAHVLWSWSVALALSACIHSPPGRAIPDEKERRGPVNIALDLVNRDVDATLAAPPEKAQALLLEAKRHFDLLDNELRDLQRFNSDAAMNLARYI